MEATEAVRALLERRADVRLAYLFGSAARGEARAASDLDVAVLFDPLPPPRDLDQLGTDLEAAAKRRVDLVVLNTATPLLAHEVVRSGRLLVCRDEDERVSFSTRSVLLYLDTAHLRRIQYDYLRERAQAYRARSA